MIENKRVAYGIRFSFNSSAELHLFAVSPNIVIASVKNTSFVLLYWRRNQTTQIEGFMKNPKDMAAFIYGIRDEVILLGLDIIRETLEDCEIVKTGQKKLVTSLGKVSFR